MSEPKHWGTFICKCGRSVEVTSEVISVGYDTQTLFKGKCECGREASDYYPEKVLRQLRSDDE